ncbi:MAG: PAS domain S-box protein [Ignavibacteria bacterium]|jgi:PAS domain S-box-containing protein
MDNLHNKTSTELIKEIEVLQKRIAELEKSEVVLRDSEQKYKALVTNTEEIICIIAKDGTFLLSEGRGLTKIGLKPGEVVGQSVFEIYKDNQDLLDDMRKTFNGETIIREVNFNDRYFRNWFSPYHNDDGEIIGLLGFSVNITEQKIAEMKLAESENRYRQLVELSPDAIMIHKGGKFMFVNNAALKMFNAGSKEEFIGKPIIERVHPDYREIVKDRVSKLGSDQIEFAPLVEEKFIKYDGTVFDVEVSANHFLDNGEDAVQVIAREITERKQSEEELVKNRSRLIRAEHVAHMGFIELDLQTNSIRWSDEIYNLYGVEPIGSQQTLESTLSLVHPEDLDKAMQSVENAIAGIAKHNLDHRIVRPDGEIIWVHAQAEIERDEFGNPRTLLGTVLDITERKLAEENLKESEEKYRSLFEQSPISLWEEDYSLVKKYIDELKKTGVNDFRKYFETHPDEITKCAGMVKIISFNKASKSLFAIRNLDGLEAGLNSFFCEESYPYFIEQLVAVAEGRTVLETEKTDQTITGEKKYVKVCWNVPAGYESTFSRVIISIIDLTERKLAEEEIRKLSYAVEQGPVSIIITDTNGKIEYVNKRFVELTGYFAEEVIGRNPRMLKSGEHSDAEYKKLWDTILSGNDWQGEFHNRKKNGDLYWESASISPLKDKNGEITHFIAIKEDITQHKKAELKLKQSEKQLDLIYNSTSDQMALIKVEDNGVYRLISFNNAYWEKIKIFNPKVKREQLLGIQIGEIGRLFNWPATLMNNLFCTYEKVVNERREISINEFLSGQQREIILDSHYSPIYDENNICTHILFTSHDITEKIQAEEAQRKSEEEFRTIFNESPIGIELYKANGMLLTANKASLNMFGIPDVSEIQTFNIFDGISLNAEKKEKLLRGESVSYQSTFDFEKVKELKQYKTSKKEKAYFDYIITPLLDNEKKAIQGYLLQVQDITERKEAEDALRESEEKFRNLAEFSPNMIFINKRGKVVYANELAEEITGYKKDEFYSDSFDFKVLIEPDYRNLIITNFKMHMSGKEVPPTEYCIRTKSGKRIDAVINTKLINYEGESAILGIIMDITERKKTEEALLESEARWRSLTENSADYITLLDRNGEILFVNKTNPGISKYDVIGKKVYDFIPRLFHNVAKNCYARVLETGEPDSYEAEYATENGEKNYYSVRVGPVYRSGEIVAMVSSSTDITKRKSIENSLKESYVRLRSLAERLQNIREEERATVAREIHDDLGQSLTALKMDISWLKKNPDLSDENKIAKFDTLLDLTDSTIQTVKRLATKLRPGILDDLGLVPAIEWQKDEFESRFRIKCNLKINNKEIVTKDAISVAVFRIVQETLTNVARHSNATRVDIKLDFQENNRLILEIHDNGVGIDNRKIKSPKSFGLIGMKERVSLLNGTMEVIGNPSKGTLVRVSIPC